MTLTNEQRKALAERIARELFHNGNGDVADRLVLTVDNPYRNLGGFSLLGATAVIDRILRTQG